MRHPMEEGREAIVVEDLAAHQEHVRAVLRDGVSVHQFVDPSEKVDELVLNAQDLQPFLSLASS